MAAAIGAMLLAASAAGAASCKGKHATIVGNGGDNKIVGTKAPDVIYAGPGNDKVYGQGGNDKICGGPGNDAIDGEKGSDTLDGGSGNDTVGGSTGKDDLFGGSGEDKLSGERGSDEMDGGGGNDSLFGETGNDRLDGGGGSDYVDGGPGDEKLVSGGAGDYDVVVGNTGIDNIDGGPGEHDVASYATSTAPLTVNLGAGEMIGEVHEHLSGIEDALGGNGNDSLIGDPAANRLDGGPGDDTLHAVGGGDAAYGGPGSDSCLDGFASENSCGSVLGGGNAVAVELIESIDNVASFVITGTAGSDAVSVRQAGNSFVAEGIAGTRVLPGSSDATNCSPSPPAGVACTGQAGRVAASMGTGNDMLSLAGISAGVEATVDGGTGADDLTGGPGGDAIYAGEDSDPDRLAGGGGSDRLFGVNTAHPRKPSGAATMLGGGGDDLMIGGQPCEGDVFEGGPGSNDSASFARIRNSGIYVRAEIGGSVTDPEGGGCSAGRIDGSTEKIEGSPGPDQLFGDGSANTLLGRGGNDLLDGKGGRDRCIGGGGHDKGDHCEASFSIP